MRALFLCCCESDATAERDSTKTRVQGSPVYILQSQVHYESMYFTAFANLMPLQREIPPKLGSRARLYILQS